VSEIFDLKVDPNTNKIINSSDYYSFLDMLNVVLSTDHNELINIYDRFNNELETTMRKKQNSSIVNKLNQTFDVESTKSLWDIWTSPSKVSNKATEVAYNVEEVDYKRNIIDKLRTNKDNHLI
jgi:hypothetical protein